MIVVNKSTYTGKIHSMQMNVSETDLRWWCEGVPRPKIQEAFPQLSPAEREFLMTGITDEEWDQLFPPEDEEGDDDAPAF